MNVKDLTLLTAMALAMSNASTALAESPSDKFDLRFWKLTLPVDQDENGKVDEIDVRGLKGYSHSDYFYLDDNGFLTFVAPNKAATTSGSTNTRSELRQMYRGINTSIGTHAEKNNFAIKAHSRARKFADIGGLLESTLRVLHVANDAKYPNKQPAYSVVVGQIHALKDNDMISAGKGFGHGNEPLKIFYKKWPGHSTGSVFWTYERNLPVDDPDRSDIAYPVWGNSWDDPSDPGESGIDLGQLFNYNVNVHKNTMYLTFRTADPAQTRTFELDLSKGVDEKDNPQGYAGDSFYFKAGAYNQCSTADSPSARYPACAGTGDWETDRAAGDYAAVAFRRIQLSGSVDPKKR